MYVDGQEFSVNYWPGDSKSGMFGGNSNWRGPIWLATSYLLIESLQRFYQVCVLVYLFSAMVRDLTVVHHCAVLRFRLRGRMPDGERRDDEPRQRGGRDPAPHHPSFRSRCGGEHVLVDRARTHYLRLTLFLIRVAERATAAATGSTRTRTSETIYSSMR